MRVLCLLCLQDLKYKILVKGKKERVAQECSSSSSDLSSSEEEPGCAVVKPSPKKECKKVKTQDSMSQEPFSFYTVRSFHDNRKEKFETSFCVVSVRCVQAEPGAVRIGGVHLQCSL